MSYLGGVEVAQSEQLLRVIWVECMEVAGKKTPLPAAPVKLFGGGGLWTEVTNASCLRDGRGGATTASLRRLRRGRGCWGGAVTTGARRIEVAPYVIVSVVLLFYTHLKSKIN